MVDIVVIDKKQCHTNPKAHWNSKISYLEKYKEKCQFVWVFLKFFLKRETCLNAGISDMSLNTSQTVHKLN